MDFFDNLPSIPTIRPMFNIGSLFDIPTGKYHIGSYGESVLNGGLANTLSLAGPGNASKSTIIIFINISVADKIKPFQSSFYDTENSLRYDRLNELCQNTKYLKTINHGDDNLLTENIKFKITSSSDILGDEYFEKIIEMSNSKRNSKLTKFTTPFLTAKLEPIKQLPPTGMCIDSLSELKVNANEDNIINKNNLGDSENNIYYMRQGIVKKQLLSQLPNLCIQGSIFATITSHIGTEVEMGRFAPKKHKLIHSKRGVNYVGSSKAFEFINNLLFEVLDVDLLNTKDKTGVLYPIIESDRKPECTDLQLITLVLTRNKSGPSGAVLKLVVSQREGVLPHLSQFHYIKESNFGIEGNNTNYNLTLAPTYKLSRTTVRSQIDNYFQVRRALEVTADLLQMKMYWDTLPNDLWCTPNELYNDIIKLGYNFNILLNTRSYWVFREHEYEELPFLSTMDLLRIRKGMYHPYFLNEDKKTYNSKYKFII